MQRNFLTKSKFAMLIEAKVQQTGLSYMESIIDLCEQLDIELEEVKKFISPTIKEKLEAEAKNLNFLPKGNELPI